MGNDIVVKWETGLQHAREYFEVNGNLAVRSDYVCDDGYNLGHWIAKMRLKQNNPDDFVVTNGQKEQLDEIGMIWDEHDRKWRIGYQHAKEYYDRHGNLDIPYRYNCPDGYPLYTWITRQRSIYSGAISGRLPDEYVDLLEELGIVWSVDDFKWKEMFTEAMAYYAKYGNLKVPRGYRAKNGKSLYVWLNKQKEWMRHHDKTYRMRWRIRELEKIGVVIKEGGVNNA